MFEKRIVMNKAFKTRHKNKNILLYAGSEIDANIYYGTNFFCPDPFIFLRTAGGKRRVSAGRGGAFADRAGSGVTFSRGV